METYSGVQGLVIDYTPIMQKEMKKKMEREMETEVGYWFTYLWLLGNEGEEKVKG